MVLFCATTALASSERVKQAEHEFQLRNFDSAFEKFKEVQADPLAVPGDLALTRCRLGIIYSIRDDQKQARRHLELSLASDALPASVSPLCFYALVQIYVIDKSYVEARDLIKKYPDPAFPAMYKARVHALGTEIGKQLKEVPFEINQLERLARVMDIGGIDKVDLRILGDWVITRDDVKKRLGESLKTKSEIVPASQANAASVQPTNQAVSPSTEAVLGEKPVRMNSAAAVESVTQPVSENRQDVLALFKSLRSGQFQYVAADVRDGSAPQLLRLNPEIPLELIRERAEQLLKDDPRQIRIGVLLPLGSGVFTRLQLKALKGISAFMSSRASKDVDYRAFVRAVGNDAGAAEEAAQELILKDKVHIIVGPFHGAQVIGAATAAAFYGVPLFTLGPVTGAQEYDPAFILRMGTLATSQARAQAAYLKQKNRKVVSIMSPSDGYGVEMTKSFEAVCKEEGIQIARVEYIDESTELFQEPVRALLGPQDGKFRGPEYAKLVADARKKAAAEKRKFDPSQIKAPAFVPFSALFVPDSLDRVRLIANTFAFFEARSVRFLGDRTWQEAGGRASVADQFLNGARVPVQRSGAFLSYLRRELAAGENVLDFERQAFDSLLLTRTAQYKAGGNNPAKLVGSLRAPDFSADGAGRYGSVDSSGEPMMEFEMAQYYNGSVLSPNASPESLPGEMLDGD
jgi:ABC-type branched-subunit amino acid transport system substrate-binding protein